MFKGSNGPIPQYGSKRPKCDKSLITVQKSQEINRKHILVGLYSELDNVTVFSLIHITLVCGQGQNNGILDPKMPQNLKIDI